MDGYAHDPGLWGQACLGNEPIYCDGLSPLNTDAVIYRSPDDEADEATRLARIRRYEECGRRYLQGRSLRILSASLRGPFDKSSGWRNPWLPNVPSGHVRRCERPSQPSAAATVDQRESSIHADTPSTQEDGTIQDRDVHDSMECHLPSPQSHEDLQFFDSASQLETRSRIESWANDVDAGVLEKDGFWAPGYNFVGRDAELSQKRSAGRDWLKRRPAKKRKLPASQSTEVTSNTTPTPTTRSRPKRSKPSIVGNRSANRSFEMTTPSSSPDKGPRESPNTVESQAAGCSEEYRQPASSNALVVGTRTRTEPAVSSRHEQQKEGEGDADGHGRNVEGEAENADLIADENQGRPRKQPSHDKEESEEIDYEDCADDSFHYRTRHANQPTPAPQSNGPAIDHPSENMVTETSLSAKPLDAITSSFGIHNQGSCHNTPDEQLNTDDIEESIVQQNENPSSVAFSDESHRPMPSVSASNESLFQFHETMFKSCGATAPITDAVSAPNVDNGRALNDITSNERGFWLNICNDIPHTFLDEKEARATSPAPFFDEGVTLIDDVMDMEEQGSMEVSQKISEYRFTKGCDLLIHYAISATDLANASQRSRCHDATLFSRTEDAVSYATAVLPQEVPAELPLTRTEPNQSPVGGIAASTVGSTTALSQNHEEMPRVTTDNQAAALQQQSPWALPCTAKHNFPSPNGNLNRGEDVLKKMTAQTTTDLFNSPALINDSPVIRPSQQSPWAEETALRKTTTGSKGVVGVDTTLIVNVELPVELPSLPLPEPQSIWAPSTSTVPPILSSPFQVPGDLESLEPKVEDEKSILHLQGNSNTPTPQFPRQSTPDGEVSIRSFSNFNFSSPQRPSRLPNNSACRSILRSKKSSSVRSSNKSIRRVLFAPLPQEQEDDCYLSPTNLRAISPPPPTIVNLEENVDGKYRKHFDAMNRRLSTQGTPTVRFYQRLLPSSSQQKPESPSVDAMAEAFREADAGRLGFAINVAEDNKAEEEEPACEVADERPQSPWQHDTQGTDDVAAVMGNLHEFLGIWDVDTEIDRNRAELNNPGTLTELSDNDIGILREAGVW